MTTNTKDFKGAEAVGIFLGAALVALVSFLVTGWMFMLWMGAMNDYVSPSIPAVGYWGGVSIAGFLWTTGLILNLASSKKK